MSSTATTTTLRRSWTPDAATAVPAQSTCAAKLATVDDALKQSDAEDIKYDDDANTMLQTQIMPNAVSLAHADTHRSRASMCASKITTADARSMESGKVDNASKLTDAERALVIANRNRTKALGVALSDVFHLQPTMLEVRFDVVTHFVQIVAAADLERDDECSFCS